MGTEVRRRATEDRIADMESGRRRTDRLHFAGQVDPERAPLRPPKPADEPPEERMGTPNVRVGLRYGAGADPDEDLVGLGHGLVDVLDPEHIGRPIAVLDDCLHHVTPYRALVRGTTGRALISLR